MTVRSIIGDCRTILPTLEAGTVQCVVTSPPYYGLRDYGTATWEGGDLACDHVVGEFRTGIGLAALGERYAGGGHKQATVGKITARGCCHRCGARRIDSQIGLEASPDEYVAEMVVVFREVRRVLRDDGTLWLNLGDSYAGSRCGPQGDGGEMADRSIASQRLRRRADGPHEARAGAKPKDLLGIPWMVAFAMRADGWYLRSDIIWHKPNPMPESIVDRPTSSHEHVFLLSKKPIYFYDADAIREDTVGGPQRNRDGSNANAGRNYRKVKVPGGWNQGEGGHGTIHRNGRTSATYQKAEVKPGRNSRNVWTIATSPFPGAHFATFPPDLAERCIKARSKPGDTVLDPFAGAGTTGLVADRLNRHGVLIELNPGYREMQAERIVSDAPLFAEVTP